jgi:cell shape-determining protein MreD
MIKVITDMAIILIFSIVQVSFLTTWPVPISSLNLFLSLVIFIAVIINYHRSLLWAFVGGLFLELYSSLNFGITSLSLILTAILINFLFSNFFTNRSFYSLIILGFIGSVFYSLVIIFLGVAFGSNISLTDFSFTFQFVWQPFLNVLILGIIFLTYHFSTGRLKHIFISR